MVKKIILTIVAIIVVAAAAVAITAVMQPDDFRITRTAVMNAPIKTVFANVNELSRWPAWSPWNRMDPSMKSTYGGSLAGYGAYTHWTGEKTGAGAMTITESRAPEFVQIKLDFTAPMVSTSTAEFMLAHEGKGITRVTWTMYGQRTGFVQKLMGLMCDKMVGKQFEDGLQNLKQVVEK